MPCIFMDDPAPLILKRASASRPSGQWSDDDYDVLADDVGVESIFKADVFVARAWMWTLIFPHHAGRSPAGRMTWSRRDIAEVRRRALELFVASGGQKPIRDCLLEAALTMT